MSPDHVQLERRVGQRFDFHLPITVRVDGHAGDGLGFTQNLSSKGALFQTSFSLSENEAVELTVVMPSEITLGDSMRVRCRGRVLRVVPAGAGAVVAVHFAGYEFLQDEEESLTQRNLTTTVDEAEQEPGMASHTFSLRPPVRL